jgi:UDP-hydrolysing UDP-N-acetyl-D-glucosamine 2-epimerase
MAKRKVVVFTGNRAEYGLQYPVIKGVHQHPDLDCHLMVSGSHLDENYGSTLEEIRNDGFHIDSEIKIDFGNDSQVSTANAIGSGVLSVSSALQKFMPDIVVVSADRFEGFAALIASTQMNIPTAHIEGGDITEGGALDDSVRHAMTKLAHFHFTTNQQSSNRIIAMGEEPWRVHTVGFPVIDLIAEKRYATAEEVGKKLSLDLTRPIMLFTQHSITTEYEDSSVQLKPSLDAIREFSRRGVQIIMTYPNNDAGGEAIICNIKALESESLPGVQVHRSLGRHIYHGLLALAWDHNIKIACVGNSSSGIKETPAFGCPTVNIGSRQEGRLRGDNVLDSGYCSKEIVSAVERCFDNKDFREKSRKTNNPYYLGDAGEKIASVLSSVPLDQKLLRKLMTLKGEIHEGWYR